MIYTDDERVYTDIIISWILKYKNNKTVYPCILIEFDDLDSSLQHECYNVFIHKDSLGITEFPKHQSIGPVKIHRPKEEVCICCWYDINKNEVAVIPFEDNYSTELNTGFVIQLIFDIEKKYNDHF